MSLETELEGLTLSESVPCFDILHSIMHEAPHEMLVLVVSLITDVEVRMAVRSATKALKACVDSTTKTLRWLGGYNHDSDGHASGIPLSPMLTSVVKVACSGHSSLTSLQSLPPSKLQVIFANRCNRLTQLWRDNLISCRELRLLDISSSIVTDLSPLSQSPLLRELNCSFTRVGDLSPLSSCTKLETLFAYNTPVSNLAPLASCPLMKVLHVFRTKIEDIEPLSALEQLEIVHLNNTLIGDITPLASSQETLKRINISDTNIIDLTPLSGCRKLALLYLTASHQMRDVALLKQALGSKLQVRML